MKNRVLSVGLTVWLWCAVGHGAFGDRCETVRAAIEIGSKGTKMKVARVDQCVNKIIELLLEMDASVPYKEALSASSDQAFNEAIMEQGLLVLKDFRKRARAFEPLSYRAIATSAFRESKNAQSFVETIRRALGISVRIIDSREEGRLAFTGLIAFTGEDASRVVVWDIGGGSQQLTLERPGGELFTHGNSMGSIAFRDFVVREIQGKSVEQSPNPLGGPPAERAVKVAGHLGGEVPWEIKERLKSGGVRVYGIGGTHANVALQTNGRSHFSRRELENIFMRRQGMSDAQIGGKLPSAEITNLALVLGMMNALDVERVITVRVNLTDGLLMHQASGRWRTY